MPTTTPAAGSDVATRLLGSSARLSYDPDIELDWDAPLADGLWFMQPERMSLYGTPLWESLTEEQRIELSKHEVSSIASVGLWFELILMQMMARELYDADHTSARTHYALTELGDECRRTAPSGTCTGSGAASRRSRPAPRPTPRSSSRRRSSTAGSAS
jgi:hypothetical protein